MNQFAWSFRGRRSTRIKEYEYSQPGSYYVTINTEGRQCLFGKIHRDQMILSDVGRMICHQWLALINKYPTINLDAFVIMPNHLHGIIDIRSSNEPMPDLISRALPDAIADRHPHRDEIIRWIAERNTDHSGSIIDAPLNHNIPSWVGAGFPRPERSDAIPNRGAETAPLPSLGRMLAYWKYQTTKTLNILRSTPGKRLWQRSYWDSIIWTERDLENVREYIFDNPRNWRRDPEYREEPSPTSPPIPLTPR